MEKEESREEGKGVCVCGRGGASNLCYVFQEFYPEFMNNCKGFNNDSNRFRGRPIMSRIFLLEISKQFILPSFFAHKSNVNFVYGQKMKVPQELKKKASKKKDNVALADNLSHSS